MLVVSACLVGVNCKCNGGNNDNEKVKGDTMGLVMPDIDKIGSVKPTNTLSKIEDIAKDNNDLVLPTLGLINNTKDVSLVSDNYLS